MLKKFLLAIALFTSVDAFPQQDFMNFVKDYYRVDPFSGSFSAFMKALSKDRHLINKKVNFDGPAHISHVSGSYKVFNPYKINASHISIDLTSEGEASYFGVPTPMYSYTLSARFDDSPYARKKLKKDFWLIVNRFRWLYVTNRFDIYLYQPPRRKDMQNSGDAYTFWFKGYTGASASTVNWSLMPKTNEIEMKITARFAVINNRAYPLGHYPGRIVDENYDLVAWKKK